jgi:hypothetical protein
MCETGSWWLDVGLQGLVSAIVGGLFTVVALLVGFRLERRRDQHRDVEEECRRLIAPTRELLVRYLELREPERRAERKAAQMMDLITWEQDLLHLVARVTKSESCFAAQLRAATNATRWFMVAPKIAETEDGHSYAEDVRQEGIWSPQNVVFLLSKRIADPAYFHMPKVQCDAAVESIKSGLIYLHSIDA